MTKAEYVAKFINDLHDKYQDGVEEGWEEINFQELLECNFEPFKEVGLNTVTEYNGEKIDITNLKWDYNRINDHMSYHVEIDGEYIGATGWYDSWAGSEIEDPEIKVGRIITKCVFYKGK